jgi:hypothetical protein
VNSLSPPNFKFRSSLPPLLQNFLFSSSVKTRPSKVPTIFPQQHCQLKRHLAKERLFFPRIFRLSTVRIYFFLAFFRRETTDFLVGRSIDRQSGADKQLANIATRFTDMLLTFTLPALLGLFLLALAYEVWEGATVPR